MWEEDQIQSDEGVWWRMPPAPFSRDIAALGVAYWEDVTHEDGGMLKYTHFVARVGLKDGKDVDDRVRKQYHNLG